MFVNGKWTKFIERKYQIFDNSLYFQLGAKLGSNKTKKTGGLKDVKKGGPAEEGGLAGFWCHRFDFIFYIGSLKKKLKDP